MFKRRIAWFSHHKEQPCDVSQEQYSELPRALSDEDGKPHKGSKSTWTDKLSSLYQTADPPVFTSSLHFTPEVVIIDAMFIINTRPLRRTKTFADYAYFLFHQFISQYFKDGTLEVHVRQIHYQQKLALAGCFSGLGEHGCYVCMNYQQSNLKGIAQLLRRLTSEYGDMLCNVKPTISLSTPRH